MGGSPITRASPGTRRAPRRSAGPRPHGRRRVLPIAALVLAALVIGLLVGTGGSDGGRGVATDFVRAWVRGDDATMFHDIDPASQSRIGLSGFVTALGHDATLATETFRRLVGPPRARAGSFAFDVLVGTRVFGTLHETLTVPVRGSGSSARVLWQRSLLFPGLRPGETLGRRIVLPSRAALLARDGSPLASGPAATGERASPLGSAGLAVIGQLGTAPASRRAELEAEGVPPGAAVGVSGLEEAFDQQLRGRPGGDLLAGVRILARAAPVAGTAIRTSVSPAVQSASAIALGGQLGGVVVLAPRTGEILGVAGLGIDDVQPPGSTFKIVTLTGVLQYGIARPSSTFPVQSAATLDGTQLGNANGESCGGTLANAFAVSCNSVFAPLGARLGAARLVATAERFGFDQPPGIPGAATSTVPAAGQLRDDLAVGSAAIGQDRDLASPLQMALVAAAIADRGQRPAPTFALGGSTSRTAVTTPAVAATVRRLMELVVTQGTGTSAALPGVTVAGKTGTAELTTTACPGSGSSSGSTGSCPSSNPKDTDAWFAAFAPAERPRVVVCVMLVADGAGGSTAAPVARQVLQSALQAVPPGAAGA